MDSRLRVGGRYYCVEIAPARHPLNRKLCGNGPAVYLYREKMRNMRMRDTLNTFKSFYAASDEEIGRRRMGRHNDDSIVE